MKSKEYTKIKQLATITAVVIIALSVVSCSSKKSSAKGELKRTQYCERYREFDDKVATAEPKAQKQLLEKILASNDFPKTPASLKKDYETVIDGYDQVEKGTYDIANQDIYKKASERISRHAIDTCELLKSNSGSNI